MYHLTDYGDSRAHPFDSGFWQQDAGLSLRYSAAVTTDIPDGENDPVPDTAAFQVVACGIHREPDAAGSIPDPNGWGLTQLTAKPCNGLDPLGHTEPMVESDEQVLFRDGKTIPLQGLESGFWGVWTTTVKTTVPGNDCFDPLDSPVPADPLVPNPIEIALNQMNDDPNHCFAVESVPVVPDLVFGVDGIRPKVEEIVIDGHPEDDVLRPT